MGKHDYCKTLLTTTMKDVRKKVSKETIAAAWGYKYDGIGGVEFHINKCEEFPESFYWHGRGCCLYYAKAMGWSALLEVLKSKDKYAGKILLENFVYTKGKY